MTNDNVNLEGSEADVGVTKQYLSMPVFEQGSAELAPEDDFKGLILRWRVLTNHVVRIIGYADAEREDERLAKARAEVVHELLLRRGIAPERFDAVSWRVHGPPSKEEYRPQYRRASVLAYNAKVGPNDWQHYFTQLHYVHEALELGCTEDEVYNLILRVLCRRMLPSKQPWKIGLASEDSLIQCRVDHPFDVHKGALLCALLSKDRTLKDMWLQEDMLGILPLKRAVYDSRLGTIKTGTSVEELYALLGERAPASYATGPHRNRRVNFHYRGFGRDCWDYSLVAGNGLVVGINQTIG